jgi:hypothetical protein
MDELELVEKRQDKIENAIEKLTQISGDLNKMLAVHEQRINQNEKNMNNLEDMLEKRREESNIQLKDVYDTMRAEDNKILTELNNMRKESTDQHTKLTDKITILENKMFYYLGGVSVIMFIIIYGPNIFKLFMK